MRLMFIKYPLIIQGKEFISAVSIMSVSLVAAPFLAHTSYTSPIRQQKIDDVCIGRSREMNLVLYDYVSQNQEPRAQQVLMLAVVIITSVEFAMYVSICIHLYSHDKSMKSLLPATTLKKRNKQNAIDLFGHILSFVIDNLFPFICAVNVAILPASDLTKNLLYALALSTYGIYSFCQILISETLKKELMNLLDALFLLPCIYQSLGFFAYIGLIRPNHAQSISNMRNNYLSYYQ